MTTQGSFVWDSFTNLRLRNKNTTLVYRLSTFRFPLVLPFLSFVGFHCEMVVTDVSLLLVPSLCRPLNRPQRRVGTSYRCFPGISLTYGTLVTKSLSCLSLTQLDRERVEYRTEGNHIQTKCPSLVEPTDLTVGTGDVVSDLFGLGYGTS